MNNNLPSFLFDPKISENDRINMLYVKSKKVMWSLVEYKELQMMYASALKEIQTKFEILNTEFNVKYKRNPISSIQTRLKSNESIINKLAKNNFDFTIENIENNLNDVAGIRIICLYIDDIYTLKDALLKQDDIELIELKDYIKEPKQNGYRSLHLIVKIPIFLVDKKKNIKVEVQIRTIAMDFWASLEHQMKYKKDMQNQQEISKQLLECATIINNTDEKMMNIRNKIESLEDIKNEDEILFERLRKLDVSIR